MLATTLAAGALRAADPGRMTSKRIARDVPLTADPSAEWWASAPAVIVENDRWGKPVAGHRSEVRSLWTPGHLYFLFRCPYEDLYLKPNPVYDTDTWELWDWDVAEVFIGSDFRDIKRYKEFEISPRGEWLDLDVNLNPKPPAIDAKWNSGFTSKTRIDEKRRVWYGEMKIPLASIGPHPVEAGREYRLNLYRIQGTKRRHLAWRLVNQEWFHNPAAFGILKLAP